MMKKTLATLILMGFGFSASAADLSASCKTYFAEIDSFLASMPAAQANAMKAQYESSKQQFASMPVTAQDKACNQAAEQLKQMKAAMPK